MTSVIVDRRSQKGKSTANRQRVLKRLDGALRAQVDKLVARHKLQESDQAAEVAIKRTDIMEPRFVLDPASGATEKTVPGNEHYRVGDKIPNSPQGQGSGDGQGGEEGDANDEDNFRFVLSREEYLSLLFDELELPALVKIGRAHV